MSDIAREYWDKVMNWNAKVNWLRKHQMQSNLFKLSYDELPEMTKRELFKTCEDSSWAFPNRPLS